MYTTITVLYFIGLILWFIPTYSAVAVAMKNFKEKDMVGGIIQLLMFICILTVYVVAILIYKVVGLSNIFFILSTIGGQ